MNIRRVLTSAALATGLGAAVLVAAPATQANAAFSDCRVGAFCLFDGVDGTRAFTDSTTPQRDGDLHNNNFGDVASSVWNRTGAYFCVYKNNNFGGDPALRLAPHMVEPRSFAGLGYPEWNNVVSSYSIVLANGGCTPA
jgi:hypothetical protein